MNTIPFEKMTKAEIALYKQTGKIPTFFSNTTNKKGMAKDTARTASAQISKERQKKTGEIFTPPALINEMLDQLPVESFAPGKTFLEPAAGDGNFVIEYLKRKIHHGCSPTQALQDTYAVEYMRDNVEVMKRRMLELCGDTLLHRAIVTHNVAYANFLKSGDTTDGRKYPYWLK